MTAGEKIGHYEIVAPLGAGGMGEVYRARDPRLNREVAIKLLPDKGDKTRFQTEARALAALNHPISSPSSTSATTISSPSSSMAGR